MRTYVVEMAEVCEDHGFGQRNIRLCFPRSFKASCFLHKRILLCPCDHRCGLVAVADVLLDELVCLLLGVFERLACRVAGEIPQLTSLVVCEVCLCLLEDLAQGAVNELVHDEGDLLQMCGDKRRPRLCLLVHQLRQAVQEDIGEIALVARGKDDLDPVQQCP